MSWLRKLTRLPSPKKQSVPREKAKRTVSFTVTPEIKDQLEKVSKFTGKSKSKLTEEAVLSYLGREEFKIPEPMGLVSPEVIPAVNVATV